MKLGGKKIEGPSEEIIVIPRSTGDLVFVARAVLDFEEFDKMFPLPRPQTRIKPGGESEVALNDPLFQQKLTDWSEMKTNWLFMQSLAATPDLEWETVNINDPKSWENCRTELHSAGLTEADVARIFTGIQAANGMDQDKIDEATKRFLATQGQVLDKKSSPNSEPVNTQSGEPVKGSE